MTMTGITFKESLMKLVAVLFMAYMGYNIINYASPELQVIAAGVALISGTAVIRK